MEEIRSTPYYTILADEVESHNVEHLAICARFVDKHSNVREEFLAFITLNRITGEQIANAILRFLEENDIPVANMRGQGYDGASNMSSERVGVQARIREKARIYTVVDIALTSSLPNLVLCLSLDACLIISSIVAAFS